LGLRALLRRFPAIPPGEQHGLIVLSSRLAVKDIGRWKDSAAPVLDLARLSNEAGAELLRDNGVWGTDRELRQASHDFDGHALALSLLASYLKQSHFGDVRRRDRVRAFLAGEDAAGHDHARRVMESYETEWLKDQPVLRSIMHIVGLFDRPASGDCLTPLRKPPAIPGLTDTIVGLDDAAWNAAVSQLREVRLIDPIDPQSRDTLDAHPLVREWFGERLRQRNEEAWRIAHGRLYEHLRDTTNEGEQPTLDDLTPLYQSIAHGCHAERYEEALQVYRDRISRRDLDGNLAFYSGKKLGALGSDLAAMSWFFTKPYETPDPNLDVQDQSWILSQTGYFLRAQGRFAEALPAQRAALRIAEAGEKWNSASTRATNLSEAELLIGEIAAALATAVQAVQYADVTFDNFLMLTRRSHFARVLHNMGQREHAGRVFADAEDWQRKGGGRKFLYSLQGYEYCDLLLAKREWKTARDRASQNLALHSDWYSVLDVALDTLTHGRAFLGLALNWVADRRRITAARARTRNAHDWLDRAVDRLRMTAQLDEMPRGLLARAVFRRSIGDWGSAARDLDEVEEIAEPGPMRLYLCDIALERARVAFARMEAFAPLNGLLDDSPPKPVALHAAEAARLKEQARANLAEARKLITDCGYHRRDEELAELEAVLAGTRRFADLPPRV
jgi:tetratricopeptide (TPR) repeat protein